MWAGQGLENETGRVGLGWCVKGLKGHEFEPHPENGREQLSLSKEGMRCEGWDNGQ